MTKRSLLSGALILALVTLNSCKIHRVTAEKRSVEITILSYNVRNCKGMDDMTDFLRVADVIRSYHPDVVALQELDSATERSGRVVVLDTLAKLTGMFPVFSPSIGFQGGKYGVGILSAKKPLGWKSLPLPGREERRSLLIVEFDEYYFCTTHWSLHEEDRISSAQIVSQTAGQLSKPVLVAGDFNGTPESPEIQEMLGEWIMLSDPAIPTFPSDEPESCIDFIFGKSRQGISWEVPETLVGNEPVASDHRPVFARIRIIR